jgi:hypothetical protein
MNVPRIRNFLTNVAAIFVPLGFLGGLLDGNLQPVVRPIVMMRGQWLKRVL